MGLDIRWPIGIMFTLISVLLIIEGALTGPSDKALNLNIDLWWGMVLLIFGVLMLMGAARSSKTKGDDGK